VGKGKLFWFFSVGFACRQKPNVLDLAVGFQHVAQRSGLTQVAGVGPMFVLRIKA